MGDQHWVAERPLDRTAMMVTHLRSTLFSEWIDWCWVRGEAEGVLRPPFADGRHAPLSGSDHAPVIAAILRDPEPHAGRSYPLVGAEELNHHDIAAKIAQTLGIPVRYEPIDVTAFAAALTAAGLPEIITQHITCITQDYRDGLFAGTNDLVEAIGGRKPSTVEQYVRSMREAFDRSGRFAVPEHLPAA